MITTLQKVKDRLQIVDTATDTLLTQIIESVGARFDSETGRKLERTVGYTEEFTADLAVLVLGCTPVEEVTKVETWDMDAVAWAERTVRRVVLAGSVLRLGEVLGDANTRLRVTYTGGYVFPPTVASAGQTEVPVVLERAAIEQAAMMYQIRTTTGIYRVEASGGTYLEVADREWVPWVRTVLKRYRRMVIE
jgi:hypothetical protein